MSEEIDPGLEMVREFHETFNCHIGAHPYIPDEPVHLALVVYHQEAARLAEELKAASAQVGGSLLLVRLQLIQEELAELAAGFISRDLVECLDALNDLSYVVDGTYLTLGLHDGKLSGMREVHRSNMSKLGPDRKPIVSEAGRVVKGPDYEPPNLWPIVERLMSRKENDQSDD
jgi:predicted HAD superfamily Cof-like phosphohydrolase